VVSVARPEFVVVHPDTEETDVLQVGTILVVKDTDIQPVCHNIQIATEEIELDTC
jgi:hypothetical protein